MEQIITIRTLSSRDAQNVTEILMDPSVGLTYMLPVFSSRQEASALFHRLKALSESREHFVRGIYLNDVLIGFLNDTEIVDSAIELGWVIHPSYQNRGYATQAVRLAIKDLFDLGFSQVIAGAFEENKPSIRVMEKCAMTQTDKFDEIEYRGKMHRCVFYSISR